MKRSVSQLGTLSVLVVIAGVLFSGCGLHRALAQNAPRSGPWSTLRAGAARQRAAQAPAIGTSSMTVTAENTTIGGVKVTVWHPASSQTPAPLVIFSHGLHGSSTQSKFLMNALAADGYLVVAPIHKDAGFNGRPTEASFQDPSTWSDKTYRDRADDILAVMNAMKHDPAWARSIDWSEVALAGHSLGGYTVLGMAGAWPSWKIPGIKAVLALSPYCAPLALKGNLGNMHVPVMYQTGTRDVGILPSVVRRNGAYDLTESPASVVVFDGGGHLAWTDLNPRYQASIDSYAIAFLDKYARGSRTADPTLRRPDVANLRSK